MSKTLKTIAALLLLTGLATQVSGSIEARVLLLGDSMMSWNRGVDKSVADVIEASLGIKVTDRSVPGARYFYSLPISGSTGLRLTKQFKKGNWDWVVLNGGGNDLLFGCGCTGCVRMLDRLVSKDGRSGAIPDFVAHIRKSGAKVLYVGYLRTPGVDSPIEACKTAGNELDRRLSEMSNVGTGVTFLSMADLVPRGSRAFHQNDMIHPSVKGSRAIGERIVRLIKP